MKYKDTVVSTYMPLIRTNMDDDCGTRAFDNEVRGLRRFMAYPVISMPARVIVAIGARAVLAELLRAIAYAVTSNPDRSIDAIGVNFRM